MTIMGQPIKKVAVYVLMVGGTATVAKFAGDSLGNRLFVQTAAEAASNPRNADSQKMFQLYRGLVIIGGGLLAGKVLWKFSRPIAFGMAAGATVSGLDRIATTYDIKRQVKNLFLAEADQIPAPAADTVPAYGLMLMLPAARPQRSYYAGPMVAREVVQLRNAG
jgi:hypothetical protein